MQTKKLTSTYNHYEIVKVPFPFVDVDTAKVRPALILSSAESFNGAVGFSIMAMITSYKNGRDLWPADVVIEEFKTAGLPVLSIVRFKLFTLDHRLILGRLGVLRDVDKEKVQEKLKEVFNF